MKMSAKKYLEMVEGTYVEPGHDVAPVTEEISRPLGPDGKPMLGWHYDSEGVCRPDGAETVFQYVHWADLIGEARSAIGVALDLINDGQNVDALPHVKEAIRLLQASISQ